MSDKAMRITDNKGFHMDLPNGVTVSVQWGPGNYCDEDVKNSDWDAPKDAVHSDEHWGSNTAECAAYLTGSDLTWVAVPGLTGPPIGDEDSDTFYDDVVGWLDVQGVLNFINMAAGLVNPKANKDSLGNKMLAALEADDGPLPGQQEFDFDETR